MESRFTMSLVTAILWLMLAICDCSHFRGGTISWKPTGKSLEVEFTYKLGWTYGGGAGCTNALSGQYVNRTNFAWRCTSGCSSTTIVSNAGYICSSASIAHNWEQGEYTFTSTFPNAGLFSIQYSGCCWISLDYGSGASGWTIATEVDLRHRSDLGRPNSSPVYTGYPIYSIKYGCKSTIRLQVSDADNDNVHCRWASGTECSSVCNAIPNAVLNQDCTLTFSANHTAGGIYAVAIMIEDKPKSTITVGGTTYTTNDVLSSIPVQFLIETPDIPSRQCDDKPVFVLPTPSGAIDIDVQQGSQLVLEFYVHSVGANITSFALAGPPGIHKSTISSSASKVDVYQVTVTWTPSMAQKGRYTLCADATDAFGLNTDPHCLQINVLGSDPCESGPCQNCGTCRRVGTTNTFQCSCLDGYIGSLCETDIDECQSTPCLNNGTCHDVVNSYVCECQPGYTGSICQTDIDECQSSPCLNSGVCFNLINSFVCGCEKGYSGTRCEIDIDECMDRPCLNGGNCTDLIASFKCSCSPAFTGEICQAGIDPCSSMPCKNNGKCLSHNSTYFTCSCMDSWEGMNCAYRHQNESFVNSSSMTGLHMRYSECDCFLGNAQNQLCYKYKKGNSIGYGALGMFLGILTVVGLYVLSEVLLSKELSSKDTTTKAEEQTKNKDAHLTKGAFGHDDADVENIPIAQEKTESKKCKPHIPGHRHRKCWACEVKYNGASPPRF